MEPYGRDLEWAEVEDLRTGELVHLMLCNFDPEFRNEEYGHQSHVYMAAAMELNQRLKSKEKVIS